MSLTKALQLLGYAHVSLERELFTENRAEIVNFNPIIAQKHSYTKISDMYTWEKNSRKVWKHRKCHLYRIDLNWSTHQLYWKPSLLQMLDFQYTVWLCINNRIKDKLILAIPWSQCNFEPLRLINDTVDRTKKYSLSCLLLLSSYVSIVIHQLVYVCKHEVWIYQNELRVIINNNLGKILQFHAIHVNHKSYIWKKKKLKMKKQTKQ